MHSLHQQAGCTATLTTVPASRPRGHCLQSNLLTILASKAAFGPALTRTVMQDHSYVKLLGELLAAE